MRLVLPEDAYADVPACWWGAERFIAHAMALYDMHYKLLYDNRMVDSVGRETFLSYLRIEAGAADFRTGRNARASIAALMKATGMSESTMHRCRRLLYKLGCRTVVYRGRQLTKLEALIRWDRGQEKIKGWTAVAALHESTSLPVDNKIAQTLFDQGIGTPPERSEGSAFLSRKDSTSSAQNEMKRGAARPGLDKRRVARKRNPAYDPRAKRMAAGVRRDERFPLWVRTIPMGTLTAAVTRKAVAGWDVDDVFGAFEDFRLGKRRLINDPRSPAGYLGHVLNQVRDDIPPARLDRARTVQFEEAERAHRRRLLEEARTAAMAAAHGMNADARQLRDKLDQGAADRAALRARQAVEARQQLAQRARES
ncbi:hypothetical protein [Nocardia brasiliensis]|uniref:hypothetical protein n=1 Tax=Nocardia brasiliensis TaxID=37326 RepID=UPI0033C24D22